jgi:hypothetical protein
MGKLTGWSGTFARTTLFIGDRTYRMQHLTADGTIADMANSIDLVRSAYEHLQPRHAASGGTRTSDARQERRARSAAGLVRTFVDDTSGRPLFSTYGRHFNYVEGGVIRRFDGQIVWFPMRYTGRKDAVMTAVDATGDRIFRFRISRWMRPYNRWVPSAIDVVVNPAETLTDSLLGVVTVASPWVNTFFQEHLPVPNS